MKICCFNKCNLLLSTSLLFVSLCSARIALGQEATIPDEERLQGYLEREAEAKRAALAAWLEVERELLPHPFDVKRYLLDLDFDMEGGTLTAETTIESVAVEDGVDRISLNFVGSWDIPRVTVDGRRAEWNHNGEVLVVDLPIAVDEGDRFSVTVGYSGRPDMRSMDLSPNRSPAMTIDPDYVYTFSQPFQARYWYPCFDEPSDKADEGCEIITRVPGGMISASNGLETSNSMVGGKRVQHWRHTYPIATYLLSIAVADYVIQRSSCGDLPIQNYIFRDISSAAYFDLGRTAEMITCFSNLFGNYAFEKYGQALTISMSGGMEHQTMTTLSRDLITGDRNHESVVAHELAHHWWGDAVTMADYRDIWLNEGFASYCEVLWAEHIGGEPSRREATAYFKRVYEIFDKRDRHSIYREDYDLSRLFSMIVYRKGALVLHMLRWELGDETFFKGLKEYYRRNKYGTVETQDLIDAMESVSGRDLEAFFTGWIYGTGHPEYEICSYYTNGAQGMPIAKGQEGATAVITVHQAQSDPTVFAMTLPIDPDGDGALPVQRHYIEGRWRQFEVSAPAVAGKADIQESDWLLMTLLGEADYQPPAITRLKNRKFKQGDSGELIISGRNFTPVTCFALSSADIDVTSVEIDTNNGTATMALEIPADHETGAVDLTVVNPDGDTVVKKKALRIKKSRN